MFQRSERVVYEKVYTAATLQIFWLRGRRDLHKGQSTLRTCQE